MKHEDFKIEQQQRIIRFLKVSSSFEPSEEIKFRVRFLKNQLQLSRRKAYILGISGGIDSTVAGRLCQLAVEELRQRESFQSSFIATRLPYGLQKDEAEAQQALDFITPDEVIIMNIKTASDAIMASLEAKINFDSERQKDFILGNIKARQRMVAQYAIAGSREGLVVGTDHAAEALTGFFTKFGDGACDLAPLYGLTKRRIHAIGRCLNVPPKLINKEPTADLESLSPLRPDEQALGITYKEIDDFLEGEIMPNEIYEIIFSAFDATEHKRALPITPD